ncbi:trigger factor [uncultured Muribaculum sp.]|uniref:trigger factor n=1 Tax=uncultured Muribaculum sp. TaxID=1918613 RepID=UPI0026746A8D|nr:trigger factor family protein [uncultured Muribaculum sp.]
MNVTLDKTGNVNAKLTVSIEENDYKAKVEKRLKEIGRTHSIPGFRQGHVPFGELNRRFGKQVTSDVINDIVYEAAAKYISENKLPVLGQPIPVNVTELDLKNNKDFTFQYELGLAPELNIELGKEIKVPYYNINASDEMVKEQDEKFRERFGAQVPGEEVEPNALVKGAIMELDENGNVKTSDDAIQMINGIVAPMYFKDREQAKLFEGHKINDKVRFNPWKTCEGNPAELASMLGVDKEKAADIKSDFEMAISEIIVLRPAEANQELFDNVLGKDKVNNEADYLGALKTMIEQDLSGNSEILFRHEIEKLMTEKYGNMELPAEVLKKWLVNTNEKITEQNVDEEYTKMEPMLKWQLIKERLAEACEIKIDDNDLTNHAKMVAARQFAQYGMTNIDDETLSDYAKRILADKQFRQRIIEETGDTKLFNALKAKLSVEEQNVSLDEFKAIAEKA